MIYGIYCNNKVKLIYLQFNKKTWYNLSITGLYLYKRTICIYYEQASFLQISFVNVLLTFTIHSMSSYIYNGLIFVIIYKSIRPEWGAC